MFFSPISILVRHIARPIISFEKIRWHDCENQLVTFMSRWAQEDCGQFVRVPHRQYILTALVRCTFRWLVSKMRFQFIKFPPPGRH
jgi:hypothetical protein